MDGEGVPGALVHLIDVTDRHDAEAALRQSEERFRSAFRDSPTGILLTTPDGTILESNRVLSRLVGRDTVELVGHPVYDLIHPDDIGRVRAQGERLLVGGLARLPGEQQRFLKRDGSG